jgi:hypothetical protein
LIELHTISSDLTAQNLGIAVATAYEVTHVFSDRYILEIEVLRKIAAEAGIYSD